MATPPLAPAVRTSVGSRDGSVEVSWTVDAAAGTATFALACKYTGWVAVGFNDRPLMEGADMYIGYVSVRTGAVTLLDTHGTGRLPPLLDTEHGGTNDATNVTGSLAPDQLAVAFTRALVTGDRHDYALSGAPVYVLYAYSDQPKRINIPIAKHASYGIVHLRLFEPVPPPTPPPTAAAPRAEVAGGADTAQEYTSPDGDCTLAWRVADDGRHVLFTVTASTGGWVAVGFNSRGEMPGADMYVGWVDPQTQQAHVFDMYAEESTLPVLDTALGGAASALDTISGTTTGARTSVTFRRPMPAADRFDRALDTGPVHLLWAYGDVPGTATPSAVTFDVHAACGTVEADIRTGMRGGQAATAGPSTPSVALVGAASVLALLVLVYLFVVRHGRQPDPSTAASRSAAAAAAAGSAANARRRPAATHRA